MNHTLLQGTLSAAVCSYDMQMLGTLGNYLLDYGGFARCELYRRGTELLREYDNGRRFDTLIVDEQMQDMDAVTLLGALKGHCEDNPPLVVMLSARAMLRRMDHGLPPGVDLCIVKPFQAATLANRVHSFYHEESGTMREVCGRLCEQFGMPADGANAVYLADAVLLACQADTKLAIRKEILLPVSEAHNVSLSSVDSALRRLVDGMETISTPGYVRFKQETGLAGEKPTVGRLIYAIKRYVAVHTEGKQQIT